MIVVGLCKSKASEDKLTGTNGIGRQTDDLWMNEWSHVDPGEFNCTIFGIPICMRYVPSCAVVQFTMTCFDKSICFFWVLIC
jgi:hypothetical protein